VNGETQLVNGSAAAISATADGSGGFLTMPDGDILDTTLYNTDGQTGPSNYDTPGDQALVLTASSSGQLVVEPSQAATYGSSQDWNVRSMAYTVDVPATQLSTSPPTAVTYGCLNGWNAMYGNLEQTSGVDTTVALVTGPGPYDLVDPLLTGDTRAAAATSWCTADRRQARWWPRSVTCAPTRPIRRHRGSPPTTGFLPEPATA
jgi:hypothetical protein